MAGSRVKRKDYNRGYRITLRDKVRAYMSTHPCVVCGFSDPRALDFHHRDPKTKTATVSQLLTQRKEAELWTEVEKCDVMCANCHRIHHAKGRGDIP